VQIRHKTLTLFTYLFIYSFIYLIIYLAKEVNEVNIRYDLNNIAYTALYE